MAGTKVKKSAAVDSFMNSLARTGYGQPNLLEATEYPLTRLTRNYVLMTSLYRSSWIVKKIINTIADDMTKNWFELVTELDPQVLDRFAKLERRTQVKASLTKALYWARLYGGAACLLMIEGDEDKLDKALKVDDVMPHSFKGLMVLDRWSGIYPQTDIVEDVGSSDFGLPRSYIITDKAGKTSQTVHHSRILRLTGRELPVYEEMAEMCWGASEIEHVYDELKKRDNTSWNIASLVFQANLRIFKTDMLNEMLAMGDEQSQRDIYNVIQAQNWMMNNQSMQIIGKEDEFQNNQYTFSGLNDIYESFMLDIAGAAEIPVTKLFGRAPGGMNATGESDLQNYYDHVNQLQETKLRPVIERLLPVMFMSEFGKVPDDIEARFNPIGTLDETKLAAIVQQKVAAINETFTSGIISKHIALKELHNLSNTTDMFSNITDEDIASAEKEESTEGLMQNLKAQLAGEGIGGQGAAGGVGVPPKEDEGNEVSKQPQ